MTKKGIALKSLLKILFGVSLLLFIMGVCSSNKGTVKKMIVSEVDLVQKGSGFSFSEYYETSTTKWNQRTHHIRGRIKFAEDVYTQKSKAPKSAIHPTFLIVQKSPGHADFEITISKGKISDNRIYITSGKLLLSHKEIKKIARDGIVVIDDKIALDTDKNLKKLSASLQAQKRKISAQYEALVKDCAALSKELTAFNGKNFITMKKDERAEFLKKFEKILSLHREHLKEANKFHKELAFGRNVPWKDFFAYPPEIDQLEQKLNGIIPQYSAVITKATEALKKKTHTHQDILAGRCKILRVRSNVSLSTTGNGQRHLVFPKKSTVPSSNRNRRTISKPKTPLKTSSFSDELKINIL